MILFLLPKAYTLLPNGAAPTAEVYLECAVHVPVIVLLVHD